MGFGDFLVVIGSSMLFTDGIVLRKVYLIRKLYRTKSYIMQRSGLFE